MVCNFVGSALSTPVHEQFAPELIRSERECSLQTHGLCCLICFLLTRFIRSLMSGTKATGPPMPWGVLIQVLLVQFSESFTLMVIAPVLPFMVKSFFQDLPAERMGYCLSLL